MTPYQHIQAHGFPTDVCTAKHLQADALQLRTDMSKHLSTAEIIRDIVWRNAIRVEMSANNGVLLLLADKFGQPSAEMLRALQATADNVARCNGPRQRRYSRR